MPTIKRFVTGAPLVKNGNSWPDAWVDTITAGLAPSAPAAPYSTLCKLEVEFFLDDQSYLNAAASIHGADLDNLLPPVFRGIEHANITNDTFIDDVHVRKYRAADVGILPGVMITLTI